MLKKVLSICLSFLLMLSMISILSGCGSKESNSAKKYGYDNKNLENMIEFASAKAEALTTDITDEEAALTQALGDTFDTYTENKSLTDEFYAKVFAGADELSEALYAVTADCYLYIAEARTSEYKSWSDAMDDVYNAWTDAVKDFYDAWNDSFNNVFKTCDKLIQLVCNELPYDEYSDTYGEMYDKHSDAWSTMYDKYSETWGRLYNTHSDVWKALYNGSTEIDDILKDQESEADKPSNEQTGQNGKADNKTTIAPSEPETTVSNDNSENFADTAGDNIEKAVSELSLEYEALSKSITDYNAYVKNVEKVKAFYQKLTAASYRLSGDLYEYSLNYAENIIKSGSSTDDMYDALEDIYDDIYDDAADILYDGIYDGILEDMYDDFYDGVIDDGMDSTSYKKWSETRSSEYKLWSGARSDCYEHWSDMRSDIYEFYSDLRSEVYGDDMERAQKVIDKFKKDIQKLKES